MRRMVPLRGVRGEGCGPMGDGGWYLSYATYITLLVRANDEVVGPTETAYPLDIRGRGGGGGGERREVQALGVVIPVTMVICVSMVSTLC